MDLFCFAAPILRFLYTEITHWVNPVLSFFFLFFFAGSGACNRIYGRHQLLQSLSVVGLNNLGLFFNNFVCVICFASFTSYDAAMVASMYMKTKLLCNT